MSFQLRKATRQKAKIRLGLSAVAGGGKTYSALLIAFGLCGSWDKIAIIDTENNSADLYAHLGDYNVLPLQAPYAPERYIDAIKSCESAGMEVIIIDSITHEWDGKGGILDISNSMTGNSYTNWAKLTPRHQAFIDTILQSSVHIITSVRRKQDYEMTKGSDGKLKVEKAGLKEVTREGFEYELTLNLELDVNHNATASKDRTGLFMDKPEFKPTIATGELIRKWCDSGAEPLPVQDGRPLMDVAHPNYTKMKEAVKSGAYTIEQVEAKYKLSAAAKQEIEILLEAKTAPEPVKVAAPIPASQPATIQQPAQLNGHSAMPVMDEPF